MLRAGMNGIIRVRNNEGHNTVVIPFKAVVEQLGEYFVYIPGDSNKVSQRKVVLGNALGADIIIKDGLKAGEPIVVEGVQNLREGVKVNIGAPAAAAAPAK